MTPSYHEILCSQQTSFIKILTLKIALPRLLPTLVPKNSCWILGFKIIKSIQILSRWYRNVIQLENLIYKLG